MKKFTVHIRSESGDDYYIVFSAERKPETDGEWLDIFDEHLPDEVAEAEDIDFEGPGVAGTFLHVKNCEEIVSTCGRPDGHC